MKKKEIHIPNYHAALIAESYILRYWLLDAVEFKRLTNSVNKLLHSDDKHDYH